MEPWRLTIGGDGGLSLDLGANPKATEAHLRDKVIQLGVIELTMKSWSRNSGLMETHPDPWRLMRE
jgi:hypothetical protein